MDLLLELLLTAFFAVLFSFLVAKLVSFTMAGGAADVDASSVAFKDVDESVLMEELQFNQKLNVGILETQKRVEIVQPSVEEKVDRRRQELVRVHDEVDASPSEEKETEEEVVASPSEEKETEEEVVELMMEDSSLEEKEGDGHGDVIEECEDRESKDVSEDEEWEGIERSEVGKAFEAAAKSVGSGDKNELLSDVQMELYGLHKVATEGPCREPQPMPLMLSARAKWNAWQKLGNMSPEEAMEQYVTLLSDRVPGWREQNYSKDGKLETPEAGTADGVAPDLSSISSHQTDYTHQRTAELKSGSEVGDMIGSSSLENQAKD